MGVWGRAKSEKWFYVGIRDEQNANVWKVVSEQIFEMDLGNGFMDGYK